MLDVTTLLHNAEDLDLQLDSDYDVELGAEARLQNTFARLDIELADLAKTAAWTDVWHPKDINSLDRQTLLKKFTAVVNTCLLFAAKKKWTELVVFDPDQYQTIRKSKRLTKTEDLDREYLAIKHFFDNAYFMHQREDFRHGWHLLVKLGIVDLELTEDEILAASNHHLVKYVRQ